MEVGIGEDLAEVGWFAEVDSVGCFMDRFPYPLLKPQHTQFPDESHSVG